MNQCNRCGFDMPNNYGYCSNCGNHINEEIKLVKKKSDKTLFIIYFIFVIITTIITIAWLVPNISFN